MEAVGPNGDEPVSPAKTQLKRWTDKLTDEDAAIVLPLVRKLARDRRTAERESEDRQDIEDARAALAEAAVKGTIPWEKVKARHGL
jgi:hypothetical protein